MNGVDFITKAFGKGFETIIKTVGSWGSAQPADDSKSGIKMGDKIYQVVVSLNGCYWYLDDEGKKQLISTIPKSTEWSWVNIAEKVIKDFKACYRTPGGKVEVWSWFLLNDVMDVLKEQHRITDSTDVDNQTGTMLESIPDTWVMIDCDLPDMTERDVTYVKRCYKTPDGKVEVEGLESLDSKTNVRESIYKVLQSTDPNFYPGYTVDTIPSNWARTVCDFPDMTERDITYVQECYTTSGGKVQVDGLLAIDDTVGTREAIYTVVQSTDSAIKAGTKYDSIPEDWVRMVCDFPDMAERHVIEINECYRTDGGKVNIKGYQAVDSVLGNKDQYYYIIKTTDSSIERWSRIDRIPNSWVKIECDFPDMSDRHVMKINECYVTPGGKIHVGGYRALDSVIGVRDEYIIVMETTDDSIARGKTYDSIQNGWSRIVCDFPDATTADTEIVENCYQTGKGKVQIRTYLVMDAYGDVRESKHMVLKTSDSSYNIGATIDEIPSSWLNIECDFASAVQRHVKDVRNCYTSNSGSIYVTGYTVVDNKLNTEKMSLTVLESTDSAIKVGQVLTQIPAGYTRTECRCNCCSH